MKKRTATVLAMSALIAGGATALADAPASAAPSVTCFIPHGPFDPSTGVVTIDTGLRQGPDLSCLPPNGLARKGDALRVECVYPENGGWYYVWDTTRNIDGWIPSHNFGLTGQYPGGC